MCTYSLVSDFGRSIPNEFWDPNSWEKYKDVLDNIKQFDIETNQPDCEEEEKTVWMKEVEERLQKIEAELFRKS